MKVYIYTNIYITRVVFVLYFACRKTKTSQFCDTVNRFNAGFPDGRNFYK